VSHHLEHPSPGTPYNWEAEEYVLVPDEGEASIAQVIFDTGLLLRVNSEVLHPNGLAMGVIADEGVVTGLVLHRTDDPQGVWYDEGLTEKGRKKLVASGLTLTPEQRGCKALGER